MRDNRKAHQWKIPDILASPENKRMLTEAGILISDWSGTVVIPGVMEFGIKLLEEMPSKELWLVEWDIVKGAHNKLAKVKLENIQDARAILVACKVLSKNASPIGDTDPYALEARA
jgi:hypothetical protein